MVDTRLVTKYVIELIHGDLFKVKEENTYLISYKNAMMLL